MLRVLGGLELAGHTFHRPKPLLLLAYLALEGPKARRHLAELFWPRAQDPLNSLSVALAQLEPLGVVEGGEVLKTRLSTDLEALRQALREGQLEWVWSTREGIALEVYRALASQARAFFLLGLPERGKAILDEAQALPGVGFALEGAGEEFHPPSPLPKEARKAFWGLYFRPHLRAYGMELEDSTLVYKVTLSKGWLGSTTFSATTEIPLVHAIDSYTQSGIGSISLS